MRMALLLLLGIAGVLLLPQYTWSGLALIALAYALSRLTTARHEERFIGVLMVLGGLGALAVVVQWAWPILTARL